MIQLDDSRWKEFLGGYRQAYDASAPLQKMRNGDVATEIWNELWEELHHQGDVDIASYASVPQLVTICSEWDTRDWNLYGIISVIEIERGLRDNPELPDWLQDDYNAAWARVFDMATADLRTATDLLFIRTLLGTLALQRGDRALGKILIMYDASDIEDITCYLTGEKRSRATR